MSIFTKSEVELLIKLIYFEKMLEDSPFFIFQSVLSHGVHYLEDENLKWKNGCFIKNEKETLRDFFSKFFWVEQSKEDKIYLKNILNEINKIKKICKNNITESIKLMPTSEYTEYAETKFYMDILTNTMLTSDEFQDKEITRFKLKWNQITEDEKRNEIFNNDFDEYCEVMDPDYYNYYPCDIYGNYLTDRTLRRRYDRKLRKRHNILEKGYYLYQNKENMVIISNLKNKKNCKIISKCKKLRIAQLKIIRLELKKNESKFQIAINKIIDS